MPMRESDIRCYKHCWATTVIFPLLMGGIGVAMVGLWFVGNSSLYVKDRIDSVKVYNERVSSWTLSIYDQYEKGQNYNLLLGGNVNSSLALAKTVPEDRLKDEYPTDLSTYRKLSYTADDIALPYASNQYRFEVFLNGKKYKFDIVPTKIVGNARPNSQCRLDYDCLYFADSARKAACEELPLCSTICTETIKGKWENNGCTATGYAQSVCVAVSINSTGEPSLLRTDDLPLSTNTLLDVKDIKGCYNNTNGEFFGTGAFHPVIYGSDKLPKITFAVRHKDDPFIYAQVITHGSLDFGASEASFRMYALIFLLSGLGAFLLGFGCFVSCFKETKGNKTAPQRREHPQIQQSYPMYPQAMQGPDGNLYYPAAPYGYYQPPPNWTPAMQSPPPPSEPVSLPVEAAPEGDPVVHLQKPKRKN